MFGEEVLIALAMVTVTGAGWMLKAILSQMKQGRLDFKELAANHIAHSTTVTADLAAAVRELRQYLHEESMRRS